MNLLNLSSEQLKSKLREGLITASVYGLGRVGIPLALAWLRAGARVIGVDVNEDWVKSLNSLNFTIRDEPQLTPLLKDFIKNGRFKATTDGVSASRESNVKLITVPTLINLKTLEFDLSALKVALQWIAKGLNVGDLVIIESSVPPTTTEKIAKPILEEISRLKVEDDFGLAFSPERVFIGRALRDIEDNYPKIIGGIGPKSSRATASLYECIAKKGVIVLSNSTAAELSKLFEGIYRDVNIALANELSMLCGKLNVDFMEIRAASNSQPYCHLHIPGIGVGGACIPIYPQFTIKIAEEHGVEMPLTSLARRINDEMPKYTVKLLLEAFKELGKPVENSIITILGIAFRGNISDTRLTPVYPLIDELIKLKANIKVHDPYIEYDSKLEENNIPLLPLEEAVENVDAIIIATDHNQFKKLNLSKLVEKANKPVILIDGRNIYIKEEIPKNTLYISISGKKIYSK